MEIKEELKDNVLTLTLKGRLDTIASEDLDNKLSEKVEGLNNIIFDLKEIDYIASSGLRVLIKYQKMFKDLEIRNVTDNVMDVLKMTGLDSVLNIK